MNAAHEDEDEDHLENVNDPHLMKISRLNDMRSPECSAMTKKVMNDDDGSGDDETTELVDLILSGRLVTPTGLKDVDDDDDDGDGDDDDEDCRGLI